MKGVNKVILVGNVGKDPEIRELKNKVANFPLATSDSYKDADGNKIDTTEWHNITIWGKLSEVVEKYVKKGDKLYLEGKLKTRSYESDGVTKYITEVVCDNMVMLSSNQNQQAKQEQVSDDLPI